MIGSRNSPYSRVWIMIDRCNRKIQISETIRVENGVSAVEYADGRLLNLYMTDSRCEDEFIMIHGILERKLAYRTDDGKIHSQIDKIPFEVPIEPESPHKGRRMHFDVIITDMSYDVASPNTINGTATLSASVQLLETELVS